MSANIRDVELEAAGHPFRIRVYSASEPTGAVLIWLHGGAFMFGTIDMPEADEVARRLGDHGVSVVSVDYTLAPLEDMTDAAAAGERARFPVASLQTVAAFDWAVANAESLGGDPDRIGLGGASAGSTIAAGTAVRLRDRGERAPVALLLAYPLLHAKVPAASAELESMLVGVPGVITFPADGPDPVTVNYVGDIALFSEQSAFPAGHDQRGMPATVIVNAELDSLRPSGEIFASELARDGVDVQVSKERGALHGFLSNVGDPAALRTVARFAEALNSNSH